MDKEQDKIDTSEFLNDTEMHKKIIDGMTQMEMARLYRFAPAGHLYFRNDTMLSDYFQKIFNELGGMTPAISKAIGR